MIDPNFKEEGKKLLEVMFKSITSKEWTEENKIDIDRYKKKIYPFLKEKYPQAFTSQNMYCIFENKEAYYLEDAEKLASLHVALYSLVESNFIDSFFVLFDSPNQTTEYQLFKSAQDIPEEKLSFDNVHVVFSWRPKVKIQYRKEVKDDLLLPDLSEMLYNNTKLCKDWCRRTGLLDNS